jgi:hypothetical protein
VRDPGYLYSGFRKRSRRIMYRMLGAFDIWCLAMRSSTYFVVVGTSVTVRDSTSCMIIRIVFHQVEPLSFPSYLSSLAFNLVAMSSYDHLSSLRTCCPHQHFPPPPPPPLHRTHLTILAAKSARVVPPSTRAAARRSFQRPCRHRTRSMPHPLYLSCRFAWPIPLSLYIATILHTQI